LDYNNVTDLEYLFIKNDCGRSKGNKLPTV
jgi:hypothetical protein